MEKINIDGKEYYYDQETDQIIEVFEDFEDKSSFKKELKLLEKSYDKDYDSEYENIENYDKWYPSKPDIDLWEYFLNRSLIQEEKELLMEVIVEKDLNKQIKLLKKNILESNCFIPKLTNNNGNCLFESLSILGLGENGLGIEHPKIIRDNISSVLLYVRNCSDFFPNVSLSPEEIFNNSNDVEFIKFKQNQEVWEYNYDMMICDLRTNYSWTRLPTELILMTISRIYQVKIFIHHNKTKFINTINVWENVLADEDLDIIHLGQINEEHYIPIIELPNELKLNLDIYYEISNINIKYSSAKSKYEKWVEIMTMSFFSSSSIQQSVQTEQINQNEHINQTEQINNSKLKWGLDESEIETDISLKDFEFIN